MQIGKVVQFGTKGYGFIEGTDGNKYFVHQKNVYNKTRLKVGTKVSFGIEKTEKGLVAIDVKSFVSSKSFNMVSFLLATSFMIHFVLLYAVFIK